MRPLVMVAWLALGSAGCGDLHPQGVAETGGGSSQLALSRLGPGSERLADVVALSPERGVVDVLAAQGRQWTLVGSFFSSGRGVELQGGGSIGGLGLVAVRDEHGSVALLVADAERPHRLGDPLQLFHPTWNGEAQDDSPEASGVALADVDGDGDSEVLVTAAGVGLAVHSKIGDWVAKVKSIEHPPSTNPAEYKVGDHPGQVTAADVDGDGRLDVAVLDEREAALYVLPNTGKGTKLGAAERIALPSVGVRVAATGCRAAPLAILGDDGQLRTLGDDRLLRQVARDFVPVRELRGAAGALAVTSEATAGLALFDACAQSATFPSLGAAQVSDAAVGAGQLAVLAGDGKTVSLFAIDR